MERRKFLIGAGSLAAGSAAAIGTGAFSNVMADRHITVAVAEDSNAYLAFQNPDQPYASYNSHNIIEFDFASDNGNGGMGLNEEASTRFNDLFDIKNQGTNEVYLWLAQDAPESGAAQSFECLVEDADGNEVDISEPGNYVTLTAGEQRSVDFLWHVSEDGAIPRAVFDGEFQFRGRDTSQTEPTAGNNDWTRDGAAGSNDASF